MHLKSFPLFASRILESVPVLHSIMRRLYCTVRPGIRFTVEQTFRNNRRIVFLKIGANDGLMHDPLAELLLKDQRFEGILVEPIPFYAELLRKNFPDGQRFKVVEAAITRSDKSCEVFYLDEEAASAAGKNVRTDLRGVASLSRQHVENHVPQDLHDIIRPQVVEGVSVQTLLARQRLDCLNLLQIDTEGADYEILQQFDFRKMRPEIVLFEQLNLNRTDKDASKQFMENHGYHVRKLETDYLCTLRRKETGRSDRRSP